MGEQRGKGLVAKRAIEQGQVVFIEKPFGYMQHVENEVGHIFYCISLING